MKSQLTELMDIFLCPKRAAPIMIKLAVLLTSHNRSAKTVKCLEHLYKNVLPQDILLKPILVDDGSTDGTAETVNMKYPSVEIVKGDGSLFWNRSMLKAWKYALPCEPDFVLWLNDDTMIEPDAISKMIATHVALVRETGRSGIVVGSTCYHSGDLSYGGVIRGSQINPINFKKVIPDDQPKPCLTMNGNVVLVARQVFESIGLLDDCFHHGMGDLDYGFRASKAGFPIWITPGFAGRCTNDNHVAGSFNDRALPLSERWKRIVSPKGLPVKAWLTFCSRHAGPLWPIFWIWPYFKLIFTSLSPRRTT